MVERVGSFSQERIVAAIVVRAAGTPIVTRALELDLGLLKEARAAEANAAASPAAKLEAARAKVVAAEKALAEARVEAEKIETEIASVEARYVTDLGAQGG